jgi:hypothetical protein
MINHNHRQPKSRQTLRRFTEWVSEESCRARRLVETYSELYRSVVRSTVTTLIASAATRVATCFFSRRERAKRWLVRTHRGSRAPPTAVVGPQGRA